MTSPNEPGVNNNDEGSNDTRLMWISVAVIVLIILGGMGINMLIHHDTNAEAAQTSSQPK